MMIKVVPAQEEHIESIVEIENKCFSVPWSHGSFLRELYSDDGYIPTAFDGEKIVGFAIFHRIGEEGEIFNIAVSPEYRGQGVGSRILEAVIRNAMLNMVKKVFLEVRPSNEPAIALYKKYGFKQVGRRKNYYIKPVEDAIIMEREV